MVTNILTIIDELNDILIENTESYVFSIKTDNYRFSVTLSEIEEFGWDLILFSSGDPFDDDIEIMYDDSILEYKEAVIAQIKRNISKITNQIISINLLLNEVK